jgi:hypothetical protein
MPLRLDQAPIEGLYSIDGYMDVSNREPEEIAAKIRERLNLNRSVSSSDRR